MITRSYRLITTADSFATLQMRRNTQTGDILFDESAIRQLCANNNMDADSVLASEDNTVALLVAWYAAHLAAGGEPDPVQEDLLAEIRAEDALGSGQSYQPGRA